jgi:hypothetical protein
MYTITCQYTGIQFESDSKRKNHPKVSALLVPDKHNPGAYQATKTALAECKAAEMTDIDEVVTYVRDAVANGNAAARERRNAQNEQRREQERQREEAKRRREATNAHLRQHGYKWYRNDAYDFDSYEESDGSYRWELHTPDSRIVTVEQALDEIERGIEVVLAEIAETQRQAQAQAEAEQAAKDAEIDAFNAAVEEATAGMVQVVRFDAHGFHHTARAPHRHLYVGEIDGVKCAQVARYFTDGIFQFWCADPAAISATPVEAPKPGSLEETFSAFFGA